MRGLCAQHFQKLYPNKVAGMVLVDSTSVDLQVLDELNLPSLNKDSTDEHWIEKCTSYSDMTKAELNQELKPELTEREKQLPVYTQHKLLEFPTNPSLYKAMTSEIKNWKDDAVIIKNIRATRDTPLTVIGRDRQYNIQLGVREGLPESELRILEDTWQQLIVDQLTLSDHSELVIAKTASHSIHMDRSDIVMNAILTTVSQSKANNN